MYPGCAPSAIGAPTLPKVRRHQGGVIGAVGSIFEQSLRCINVGGRVLVLGFAGGRIGNVPANLPLLKNAAVIGSFQGGWRKRHPEALARMTSEMLDILAASGMRTPIGQTFRLSEGAEAMEALISRKVLGKVLLVPRNRKISPP